MPNTIKHLTCAACVVDWLKHKQKRFLKRDYLTSITLTVGKVA